MLNLYLISQNENDDYDTYDMAVVAANSETEAQRMHPEDGKPLANEREDWSQMEWVQDPAYVQVRLIGIADSTITEPKVICASYRAG